MDLLLKIPALPALQPSFSFSSAAHPLLAVFRVLCPNQSQVCSNALCYGGAQSFTCHAEHAMAAPAAGLVAHAVPQPVAGIPPLRSGRLRCSHEVVVLCCAMAMCVSVLCCA